MTNYQRNMNRRAMAKRLMILLIIISVVSLLVGFGVGYGVKTHITNRNAQKNATATTEQVGTNNHEYTLYGTYDNRHFTQEISLDWGSGDLDFQPLDCDMPIEHQEFLYYLCSGYNLDFALVMGLIETESTFTPGVVSKSNDYGYMQINEINHEWLTETIGVTDFLDPYQNMRAGCFILRQLFEKYQDTELVLMCYNLGETGATRLWQKDVFSTEYTESVLRNQKTFNEQLEGD